MRFTQKFSRSAMAAAGVSFAAIVAVGLPGSAAYVDDEPSKDEKEVKSKTKTIKIIRSGKPIVIERSGGHYVLKSKDHDHETQEHEGDEHNHNGYKKHGSRSYSFTIDNDDGGQDEALERIQASLEKVEKRLKKARKKSEKAALEAARDGLKTAIEALKMGGHNTGHQMVFDGGHKDMAFLGSGLSSMRVEIDGELTDLRETIRAALKDRAVDGGIHREMDRDGTIRILRLGDGMHKSHKFSGSDKEYLEALKRAEEELRSAREKLEKRLADKKSDDDNDD